MTKTGNEDHTYQLAFAIMVPMLVMDKLAYSRTKAVIIVAILILGTVTIIGPRASAMTELTLASSTFFGGPGDQRGTGIAIAGGAIYVSGHTEPIGTPTTEGFVVRYAIPPTSAPAWSKSLSGDTPFNGVAATNEGVYAVGISDAFTNDFVGGKEGKTFLAKFSPDGTAGSGPGGSLWAKGGPGNIGPGIVNAFFAFSGVEIFTAATTAVEGGSTFVYATGGGQPCSGFAYILAKYDTSGNFIKAATDSANGISFPVCSLGVGGSNSQGVTILNGNVYIAGLTDPSQHPYVAKYDPNLNLLCKVQDTSLRGQFNGITAVGNAIYAVGLTFTDVAGSERFLVQKYDETCTRLWSQTSSGPNTDVLTGVVGIGSHVFAVGYTKSQGAGGFDAAILEIDPSTGNTLSTTLFGGALDDKANGVATDGTDLFVVGESRSFASADGNLVGQNDLMLLRYTITSPTSILSEVQNIEKKLDGTTTSLITQIMSTLTSIQTSLANIGTGLTSIQNTLGSIQTSIAQILSIVQGIKEKPSVTLQLKDTKLLPGEVLVLLDTTGSGTLGVVHVAANLPCNGGSGPTPGLGNDTPDVKIVAGVAGGALGDVIGSAAQDTGFVGPENTCVFHGTFSPTDTVPTITDIILINAGTSNVELPEGATVTITGTYT